MKKLNLTKEQILEALKKSARPSIRRAAKLLGISHTYLMQYMKRFKITVDKV